MFCYFPKSKEWTEYHPTNAGHGAKTDENVLLKNHNFYKNKHLPELICFMDEIYNAYKYVNYDLNFSFHDQNKTDLVPDGGIASWQLLTNRLLLDITVHPEKDWFCSFAKLNWDPICVVSCLEVGENVGQNNEKYFKFSSKSLKKNSIINVKDKYSISFFLNLIYDISLHTCRCV